VWPTATTRITSTPVALPPLIDGKRAPAGRVVTFYDPEGNVALRNLAWSPDGKFLAVAAGTDTVRIGVRLWRVDGAPARVATNIRAMASPAWSPDGGLLAVKDESAVYLYRPSGTDFAILSHTGAVNAFSWSPDRKRIATSSLDQTGSLGGGHRIRIWSKDNQVLGTAGSVGIASAGGMPSTTRVDGLAWSPDGATLQSVDEIGTLQQWTADGRPLRTLERAIPAPRRQAWSPDRRVLATAGTQPFATLWDADGQPLAQLDGHTKVVTDIAWSPDGAALATSSDDGTVRVWRADGTLRTTLGGHSGGAQCVAWSPDGKTLATGDGNGTVRLWRLD